MGKLHPGDQFQQVCPKDQFWVNFFFLFTYILIYLYILLINDLLNELKSNVKLFADDTFLFTIVQDKNESANTINNDQLQISKWAYNQKMIFNADTNKPAQEVPFSRKKQSTNEL